MHTHTHHYLVVTVGFDSVDRTVSEGDGYTNVSLTITGQSTVATSVLFSTMDGGAIGIHSDAVFHTRFSALQLGERSLAFLLTRVWGHGPQEVFWEICMASIRLI